MAIGIIGSGIFALGQAKGAWTSSEINVSSGLFLAESVDYKNFTIHVRTIFKSFGAGSRGSLEHRYSYMGTIEPAITASIVMPVHTFASPMTEDWATRQQALDRAIARAKRIIDGTVVE